MIFMLFVLKAQKQEEMHKGTKGIAIIFSDKKPLKAYADVTDCSHFMRKNMAKSYFYQDVNLHYGYTIDSTTWKPNNKMIQDDIYNPEPIDDKFLAKDSICVIMQENFNLADRAYTLSRREDCNEYADNFKLKYYKVLYLYRDKKSYDKIYEIKKKRLGVR
jgi:hypothetical protein